MAEQADRVAALLMQTFLLEQVALEIRLAWLHLKATMAEAHILRQVAEMVAAVVEHPRLGLQPHHPMVVTAALAQPQAFPAHLQITQVVAAVLRLLGLPLERAALEAVGQDQRQA